MHITADRVGVVIDGRTIVEGATVTCRPGTMTALVGPSGSGKTTLLHCLGLLQLPTTGHVRVDSVNATGWGGARRSRFWRDHAAFVLQDYGIVEDESVAYNVTLRRGVLGRKALGNQRELAHALARTGLRDRANEPAVHLSGGEKQRLAVARAIYNRATVIFVDEPTASLDDENRRAVIALLRSRAGEGCTVVVSTHDDDVISSCDDAFSLMSRVHTPANAESARRDTDAQHSWRTS